LDDADFEALGFALDALDLDALGFAALALPFVVLDVVGFFFDFDTTWRRA